MALSSNQISAFEQAMQGPGPEWDPDWVVTQQLIKLVSIQGKQLIMLQAQLDALTRGHAASMDALFIALQDGMRDKQVAYNHLRPAEVEAAVQDLNNAIAAAQRGEQAAQYAGNVLKFVAKLVL